jgi:rubredoxin
MEEDKCLTCGYVYNPNKGDATQNVPGGTPFECLPDDWRCPECGAPKEDFVEREQ